MQFKPFRPPSFLAKSSPTVVSIAPPCDNDIRPSKKPRLSDGDDSRDLNTKTVFRRPTVATAPTGPPASSQGGFRTPLVPLTQPSSQPTAEGSAKRTYRALYRKVTAKKHKTWDGDGTVIVGGGYAELRNEKGKCIGRTKSAGVEVGDGLTVSGNDVEVGEVIDEGDEQEDVVEVPRPVVTRPVALARPNRISAQLVARSSSAATAGVDVKRKTDKPRQVPGAKPKAFVNPLAHSTAPYRPDTNGTGPSPRHDAHAEGALVMQRPTTIPTGKQLVDVVVDPLLCRRLREHQRAGVSFMYECVMGMRCREGAGAILADEMGLGKTLQTIALLWTLLKQNPIHGEGPVVRKAIIICPASVTKNWRKEFRKWLGNERVGVLLLDDQKKIRSFTRGKSYQVLVVGYEMFNLIHKDLQKCNEIDIIVADEGHRLKTAKNKTAAAIKSLDIERRIVLTGTLLQNDYSEWYSVVDFVNPGYLGKYTSFKKDFENPILRARQQGASPEDVEKGEEADRELKRQTGAFIIRRTADILTKYLPPKTEYVLLCRPTEFQIQVYNTLLSSGDLSAVLRTPELSLQLINLLKKACNSPSLLSTDTSDPDSLLAQITASFPPLKLKKNTQTGKLRALDSLLHTIRSTTTDKVVIMSNYTSTLDILAPFLSTLEYRFTRLDGSTPVSKRQDLVDTFNSAPVERQFIFLLSTKAGGVGLNLTGANRLVLFDLDWNPALDMQAMARTHRDGQKRECWIYRLVTKGAIEEKIFQRQCSKSDLAGAVVDDRRSTQAFSHEVLRDLFRLDTGKECATHEALGCGCGGVGRVVEDEEDADGEGEGVIKEEEDDEDDDLPLLPGRDFRPASRFDLAPPVTSRGRSRSGSPVKSAMDGAKRGLMLYSHLDARAWRQRRAEKGADAHKGASDRMEEEDDEVKEEEEDDDEPVQDAVLRAIMAESDSPIDFVFAKRSKDVSAAAAAAAAVAVAAKSAAQGEGQAVVL
ncbi:hypothetical protein K461DRAFT_280737 [Myriangium duriaei CBS 260.36]|uniref:DNA repair and recombination protein RAD54B n=1 Tax=Myriangium duriaei CBS 260.36 TaxID=1168546 RepID=A0A9P4IZW5_9PEZI|nr:hypothetical protein K461DRAFT_280737 [Myriangium duriaei CBS 260.36]